MTAERKYALTRVEAGDYLLPSNDARVLWRISAYDENGSASWVDEHGREHVMRGVFWQTARWRGGLPTDADVRRDDFLDWDRWETWSTSHATRREAIHETLRDH